MARGKIRFLDISVYDRQILSIEIERSTTRHSIGYLDYLGEGIEAFAVRFGAANQNHDNWRLFTYSLTGLVSFCRYVRHLKPDAVLFHSFRFPIRFVLLKWLLPRAKFIVQHHAGDPSPNPFKRAIQSWCYAKSDCFNFVTRHQAEAFYRAGIIRDDAQVLETMVGSTDFKLLDKRECRRQLGLSQSEFTIIWVGHLNSNKDPMTLMRALGRLHEGQIDFRLIMFFGQTFFLHEAQEFARMQEFDDKVSFRGQVPNQELEIWLNAADCYVSCSHNEGSGIALAEALACGCTPVVTRIPSFNRMTPRADLQFGVGNDAELFERLVTVIENTDFDRNANRFNFEKRLSFPAIASDFRKRLGDDTLETVK